MRQSPALLRWLAAVGAVATVAAGLLILPSVLTPQAAAPVVIPPAADRAAGPPSFELVRQLRAELTASAQNNPDFPIDPAEAALVATSPQEYTPLGRIQIDAIGLDVEYAAGVHPSVLERGPGHWPGSATPGQPGSAVLSGHRTTWTRPFRELDQLAVGEPIVVTPDGAAPVTYRVTATEIVPEAQYRDEVLAAAPDPQARQLVLFACHPTGQRTHRIVVRAQAEPATESDQRGG